eukprot:804102-Amphidinium_carterae.1
MSVCRSSSSARHRVHNNASRPMEGYQQPRKPINTKPFKMPSALLQPKPGMSLEPTTTAGVWRLV